MEEVELRLVNSTPFCQLSVEFPDITMFRWCSSVVDYVEVYGESKSVKMAMERLKEITESIDSQIVTSDRMEDHVSAGISCRCNTVNSSIRLAESMNLLWEAPAVYANGEEKLRLVSFSGEDLDAFYLEVSRAGKAVIERKKRIEPDSLKDVARLMKVHLERILNYFTHRITNARAEGINSKIALIEKMAFGYRNREHLKTAIYFRCSNLQLLIMS